jgi:hypothetical protein
MGQPYHNIRAKNIESPFNLSPRSHAKHKPKKGPVMQNLFDALTAFMKLAWNHKPATSMQSLIPLGPTRMMYRRGSGLHSLSDGNRSCYSGGGSGRYARVAELMACCRYQDAGRVQEKG